MTLASASTSSTVDMHDCSEECADRDELVSQFTSLVQQHPHQPQIALGYLRTQWKRIVPDTAPQDVPHAFCSTSPLYRAAEPHIQQLKALTQKDTRGKIHTLLAQECSWHASYNLLTLWCILGESGLTQGILTNLVALSAVPNLSWQDGYRRLRTEREKRRNHKAGRGISADIEWHTWETRQALQSCGMEMPSKRDRDTAAKKVVKAGREPSGGPGSSSAQHAKRVANDAVWKSPTTEHSNGRSSRASSDGSFQLRRGTRSWQTPEEETEATTATTILQSSLESDGDNAQDNSIAVQVQDLQALGRHACNTSESETQQDSSRVHDVEASRKCSITESHIASQHVYNSAQGHAPQESFYNCTGSRTLTRQSDPHAEAAQSHEDSEVGSPNEPSDEDYGEDDDFSDEDCGEGDDTGRSIECMRADEAPLHDFDSMFDAPDDDPISSSAVGDASELEEVTPCPLWPRRLPCVPVWQLPDVSLATPAAHQRLRFLSTSVSSLRLSYTATPSAFGTIQLLHHHQRALMPPQKRAATEGMMMPAASMKKRVKHPFELQSSPLHALHRFWTVVALTPETAIQPYTPHANHIVAKVRKDEEHGFTMIAVAIASGKELHSQADTAVSYLLGVFGGIADKTTVFLQPNTAEKAVREAEHIFTGYSGAANMRVVSGPTENLSEHPTDVVDGPECSAAGLQMVVATSFHFLISHTATLPTTFPVPWSWTLVLCDGIWDTENSNSPTARFRSAAPLIINDALLPFALGPALTLKDPTPQPPLDALSRVLDGLSGKMEDLAEQAEILTEYSKVLNMISDAVWQRLQDLDVSSEVGESDKISELKAQKAYLEAQVNGESCPASLKPGCQRQLETILPLLEQAEADFVSSCANAALHKKRERLWLLLLVWQNECTNRGKDKTTSHEKLAKSSAELLMKWFKGIQKYLEPSKAVLPPIAYSPGMG